MGYKYYAPQIKSRHHHKSVTGVDLATARIHLETNVSRQSISRWNEKVRLTGCVVSDPATYKVQGRNPIYDDDDLVVLHDVIQEDPTLYLDEIQDIMHQLVNKKPCIASIAKTIEKKLKFTFKKGGTVDPRQSLEMQGVFSRRIGAMPSQYMVFLDEVGANERDIFRKYIRSEKGTRGERLVHSQQGVHWTMCGAICEDGFIAGAAVEGGFNRERFEGFLEFILLPRMNVYPDRNSVLIMDNCPIHRRGRIGELCFNAGVLLIYLPTYSPNLNPIEKCWNVLKAYLIRTGDFRRAEDKGQCLTDTAVEILTAVLTTSLIRGSGYAPGV